MLARYRRCTWWLSVWTCAVPPRIENDRRLRLKANLGSSVELPCSTSGVPKPRVVWQKGTRILDDQSGNALATLSIRIICGRYLWVRVNCEAANLTKSISLRFSLFVLQFSDAVYLSELCVPVADVPGRRHLRSASRGLLNYFSYNLSNYARRAFSHAGPYYPELPSLQRAELSFHHFV